MKIKKVNVKVAYFRTPGNNRRIQSIDKLFECLLFHTHTHMPAYKRTRPFLGAPHRQTVRSVADYLIYVSKIFKWKSFPAPWNVFQTVHYETEKLSLTQIINSMYSLTKTILLRILQLLGWLLIGRLT